MPKNNQRLTKIIKERKIRGHIMCKAAEVGKIVINRCLENNLFIDTQKLQKLLVLMQVECIKRSGKPLFVEDIRIWNCGVAIKEVDDEFRGFGEPFLLPQEEFINLLDMEDECVNYILEKYGAFDVMDLNTLPVIERVVSLSVIPQGSLIPHINYQMLIGAFFLS